MAKAAGKGRTRKSRSTMAFLRRISQGVFLAVFIVFLFLTENTGEDELVFPVRIFLDFDPLHSITYFLATFSLPDKFYLAAVVLILTVVLGRVFCGWVCPLGSLNQLVNHRKKDRNSEGFDFRRLKYLILIGLVVGALFGLNLSGLLDPISLTVRSLALTVIPAWNLAAVSAFDLYAGTPAGELTDPIYYFLRDHHVIAYTQPYFHQSQLLAMLFALVLLLNLRRKRFFCRYICPLGALLGAFSRRSFIRLKVDDNDCISCNLCNKVCPSGAQPWPSGEWKNTECFVCYNCVETCPARCIAIDMLYPPQTWSAGHRVDLGRRRVMTAAVTGALAVPVTRALPREKKPEPSVIRPPGSRREPEFLSTCVRCGECMKVCITNGLQPAFMESGIEGLWTPVFDMKTGYCEYSCTLCGQVCPTQAIRALDVSIKRKVKIGLAFIDPARCLPHAFGIDCIVCEEHCPLPKKAIWFENKEKADREGDSRVVKLPVVDPDLCNGCGICQNKCPVVDLPAIRISSIGESRSEKNRLLL
ncbi:4Fe-4S binding protein [Acidobacteriota bacterium]